MERLRGAKHVRLIGVPRFIDVDLQRQKRAIHRPGEIDQSQRRQGGERGCQFWRYSRMTNGLGRLHQQLRYAPAPVPGGGAAAPTRKHARPCYT
jgi:hypothetical protein